MNNMEKQELETEGHDSLGGGPLYWRPLSTNMVAEETISVEVAAAPVPCTNNSSMTTATCSTQQSIVKKAVGYDHLKQLSDTYALCITGDVMASIGHGSILNHLVPHISIFARVSPEQKEMVC